MASGPWQSWWGGGDRWWSKEGWKVVLGGGPGTYENIGFVFANKKALEVIYGWPPFVLSSLAEKKARRLLGQLFKITMEVEAAATQQKHLATPMCALPS